MRLFFILMPEKSISVFHKTNAKNIMDLLANFLQFQWLSLILWLWV